MSDLWIALAICAVLIVSAAMPLIKERGKPKGPPRLPPRPETLHDWRKEKRGE
jgi:hypothetical protein